MLQGNLRGSLVQQLQMHLAQRQADPWLNLPTMQETQVQSLGQEDPLEKGMATHSCTLAWRSLLGLSNRTITTSPILQTLILPYWLNLRTG